MYILKNALTAVARNKGRNILLGIIIMVISSTVSVTLAINNSSKSLIESYENKYEVEATLEINRQNLMKDFDPENRENSKENMKDTFSLATKVTESEIENYSNSSYVKSYYYVKETNVNSTSLEKATMESGNFKGFGRNEFNNMANGDFVLKGYSTLAAMNEFISGNYKITSGEVFTNFNENSCLINSELASLNELKVGDIITIIDPTDETKTYELKIEGIFEETSSDNTSMSMFSNSVNTIITSTNFISEMQSQNENLEVTLKPTFILTNKEVIEKFENELKEKGLNENLTVKTNLDTIENATSTISNVKTFSLTFLTITLIIGAIVLLVINMINIRERKYEIGVLRTIGMKKREVSLQFVLELFMVSFVFMMLGTLFGSIISVPVSNNLLKNEITLKEQEQNNLNNNFGRYEGNMLNKPHKDFMNSGFGITNIQAFDSINATVDLKVLGELLVIGLFLTLISSVSAISSIQKFSPLEILKERS